MKLTKTKINIFGLGRSGTKALQLYIAYIFAKNEGRIHLNYEPYNFLTKAGPLNYAGLYYNYNSKLFVKDVSEFNLGHRNFIKSLIPKTNSSIITKFVHANGRIRGINKIMKPDLTIIIIRDLFETLSSLARMKWDYLTFGYFLLRNTYINIWDKFIMEVKDLNLVEDLNEILKQLNDVYHMNAFYWYCMNLSALNYRHDNTIFIDYKDLKYLAKILDFYIPYKCDEK